MIALFKMEFYKLWHRSSFLILVVCLLGSNIGYLCYTQFVNREIPISVFQAVEKKLNVLPNSERYDYLIQYQNELDTALVSNQIQELALQEDSDSIAKLAYLYEQYPELKKGLVTNFQLQFSDNYDQETNVLNSYLKEMTILHDYKSYLNKIAESAENLQTISLFQQKDEYNSRNIKKTAQDYQNLQNITITYSSEKGVIEALSVVTSILLCIALFAIAAFLIFEEKERNLFCLIKTTPNGQGKSIIIKLLVMISSVFLLTILFFTTNLIFMHNIYGLGDLSRSLQSLASYSKCALNISVSLFLILFIFLKWITLCCLGALILFAALISKNRFIGIASVLGLLFISYLFSTYINANGPLKALRYCNFYTFLQSEVLLKQYVNVSVFHHPVSLLHVSILLIMVCFSLSHSICIIIYLKKKNLQTNDFVLPYLIPWRKSPCSLWRQECFKYLWLQKASILILLFIIFQGYQYQTIKVYHNQDERFFSNYMNVLEGPYTEEKAVFIENESKRMQTLHQKIDKITADYEQGTLDKQTMEQAKGTLEQQLLGETIFQDIVRYADYVKEDNQREFVLPFGHEQLFQKIDYIVYPTIFLILMLMFTSSNLFTFEYHNNVQKLLNACIMGRKKLFRIKMTLAICTIVFLFIVANVPYFLVMAKTYGLSSWQASMNSITTFSYLPSFIQIWQYYVLIFSLRIFAIFSFFCIMSYFSVTFKQQLTGIFFGFLFFFVPLLLSIMNIHLLDAISLKPLLMPTSFFLTCISLIGYMTCSGYALFIVHKRHLV